MIDLVFSFAFVSSVLSRGDGMLVPASVISADPALFHDTSLFAVCAREATTELVEAQVCIKE